MTIGAAPTSAAGVSGSGDASPAAIGAFWDTEAAVSSLFDEIIRPMAPERWNETGPTPDWTLRDHVAHLAASGHVRAHVAMVGPWCVRIAWPATSAARNGEAA